jgi:hypothetical protein
LVSADPFGSFYEIEVVVAAWQRERVLAAEGGDPQVVGGDGFADALEFLNDFGIVMRGWPLMSNTKESWIRPVRQFSREGEAGNRVKHHPVAKVLRTRLLWFPCLAKAKATRHGAPCTLHPALPLSGRQNRFLTGPSALFGMTNEWFRFGGGLFFRGRNLLTSKFDGLRIIR